MALTAAQRQAVYDAINLGALDNYASNETSLIEEMTPAQIKQGLTCGTLKLEHVNFLFLRAMFAAKKAEDESKTYTDSQIQNAKYKCSWKSPREGNLIVLDAQPDGSCLPYYGVIAEDSILNLFIDSAAGDDSATGTRASPMRTIRAALARGSAGVNRTIWLKELQTHIVDASNPATLRGGELRIYPYGANVDNLPPVIGDYDWSSQAGKALASTIMCPSGVPDPEGFYNANGLILADNAVLISSAINYKPAPRLAGLNIGAYIGMLSNSPYAAQSVVMSYGNIDFDDDDSYLTRGSSVPMKLEFLEMTVTGATGVIATASPSLFLTQSSPTSATQSDLRLYIRNKLTATTVFSNFNTNLLP
jgi:hypothetical protein